MNKQNTLSNMFSVSALPQYSMLGNGYGIIEEVSRNDIFIFYSAFNELSGAGCVIAEFCPVKLISRREGTKLVPNTNVSPEEYALLVSNLSLESSVHMRTKPLPGIARVMDHLTANGTGYVVYDLSEANALSSRPELSMDQEGVQAEFFNLFTSLAQLHSEGVYHTAISPECIFASGRSGWQLAGFAESVTLGTSGCLMQRDDPYNWLDKHKSYDDETLATADAYSAAAVCYKLLGGSPQAAGARNSQTLVPIDEINPQVGKTESAAVMEALEPIGISASAYNRFVNDFFGLDLPIADAGVKKAVPAKKKPKTGVLLASILMMLLGAVLLALFIIRGGFKVTEKVGVDVFSKGFMVPNIVGMTVEEAKAQFDGWEFTIKGNIETDAVPENCITEQSPLFGSMVAVNEKTISVTINRGKPKENFMPNLMGMSVEEAKELLSDYSVTVVKEYDDTVEKGRISGTEPGYNSTIVKGQEVKLTESLGGLLRDIKVISDKFDYFTEGNSSIELDKCYNLIPANVDPSKVSVSYQLIDPQGHAEINNGVLEFVENTISTKWTQRLKVSASMVDETTGETKTVTSDEISFIYTAIHHETETPKATPDPATPTPRPATPTPRPATPTPRPATATPKPPTPSPKSTRTPRPGATATPRATATPTPTPKPSATPTPTTPPPSPTAVPVTPMPVITPTPKPSTTPGS